MSTVLLSEPVMTVFRKLELGLALDVCPMPRKSTTLGSRLTKFNELRGPNGPLPASVVIFLQKVNAAIVELLGSKGPLLCRRIQRRGEWFRLAEENVVKALSDHVAAKLRGLHRHLLLWS